MNIFSPFAHLITVFVFIVPVFLSVDPYTPTLFIVLALINLFVIWKLSVYSLARLIVPILILPVGIFVLNLLLTNTTGHIQTVKFLTVAVNRYALNRAAVLSLRTLALIVISVGYLLVTDPRELVNALMQQVGLSPRVGFSIYVAWNAVPLLRGDLGRIRKMHRVRLRGRGIGVADIIPTGITLLAGAIRHAQRAAVSMAVRGIESEMPRSYLKESRWRPRDTVYVALTAVATLGFTLLLAFRGLFRFGLG